VNQKDVDKYFIPKNMTIDEFDSLPLNTRAYIQQSAPDMTYAEALRWQKS